MTEHVFYYRYRGTVAYYHIDDVDEMSPSCCWWIIPGMAEVDAALVEELEQQRARIIRGEQLARGG